MKTLTGGKTGVPVRLVTLIFTALALTASAATSCARANPTALHHPSWSSPEQGISLAASSTALPSTRPAWAACGAEAAPR